MKGRKTEGNGTKYKCNRKKTVSEKININPTKLIIHVKCK